MSTLAPDDRIQRLRATYERMRAEGRIGSPPADSPAPTPPASSRQDRLRATLYRLYPERAQQEQAQVDAQMGANARAVWDANPLPRTSGDMSRAVTDDESIRLGTLGRNLGPGLARGAIDFPAQLADASAALARSAADNSRILRPALDPLAGAAQRNADAMRNAATLTQRGFGVPQSEGTILDAVGEGGFQMGAATLAGAATGGAAALPVFAGLSAAPVMGSTYRENLNETGDRSSAAAEAMGAGAITGATSMVPGVAILRKVPGGSGVVGAIERHALTRMGMAGGAEAAQEYVEGASQDVLAMGVRQGRLPTAEELGQILTSRDRIMDVVAGGTLGAGARGGVEIGRAVTTPPVPRGTPVPATYAQSPDAVRMPPAPPLTPDRTDETPSPTGAGVAPPVAGISPGAPPPVSSPPSPADVRYSPTVESWRGMNDAELAIYAKSVGVTPSSNRATTEGRIQRRLDRQRHAEEMASRPKEATWIDPLTSDPNDPTIGATDSEGNRYSSHWGEEWYERPREWRQERIAQDRRLTEEQAQLEADASAREAASRERLDRDVETMLAIESGVTAVVEALRLKPNQVRVNGTGSQYITLPDGTTIRVSDHEQVPGGGWLVRETAFGIEEGRAGTSDVSIVVAPGKPLPSAAEIRAMVAKAKAAQRDRPRAAPKAFGETPPGDSPKRPPTPLLSLTDKQLRAVARTVKVRDRGTREQLIQAISGADQRGVAEAVRGLPPAQDPNAQSPAGTPNQSPSQEQAAARQDRPTAAGIVAPEAAAGSDIPASPTLETGPVASPQSTREPWEMTREAAPRDAASPFERRHSLAKPIKGKTGAEIVAYRWMSQMEEGMFRDRRVSDWSQSQISEPTGREIVHLFLVRTPDGKETLMGVGAAKKALGMQESALRSIADREAKGQQERAKQWDRSAASIEAKAATSEYEANRAYRLANNPAKMMWGTPAQHEAAANKSFESATMLRKGEKYLRTGDADTIDNLTSRGWEVAAQTPPQRPQDAPQTPPTDVPDFLADVRRDEEEKSAQNPRTQIGPQSVQTASARESTESAPVTTPPPAAPTPADTLSDADESQTSARNAMMDVDRAAMGLDALDGPTRRSWGRALGDAKRSKKVEQAMSIAQQIVSKPRVLTDTETAALVIHASGLKTRHAELMAGVESITDPAEIRAVGEEAMRLEQDFDVLTNALRAAGTETGRALAARKLTIDQDFKLLPTLARAKAAKGKNLSPEERAKLESVVGKLEEMTKRAEAAEKKLAERRAERATVRKAPGRDPGSRRTPQQRESDISRLLAKTNELLKKGCR